MRDCEERPHAKENRLESLRWTRVDPLHVRMMTASEGMSSQKSHAAKPPDRIMDAANLGGVLVDAFERIPIPAVVCGFP